MLLQLRAGQPLLVVIVARGRGLHIGDAVELLLYVLLVVAHNRVAGHAEFHGREAFLLAAAAHVGNAGADLLGRVTVHHVAVALGRDEVLGRFRLAARVQERGLGGLGLQHVIGHLVILAVVAEMVLLPHVGHHVEPLAGAGVPVVVLLKVQAVLGGLIAPPARYHVQREPAGRNQIDVGGLLGQQRRLVKRGPHGHHNFQVLGHGGQRGGRAPGLQRRRLRTLDVVQVQFRHQRQVVAESFAALR